METDVLIVAAHPDDAELGMGGTIASLCAAGKRVAVVDLTNGEPTPHGSPELRAEETRRASEILGLKERRLLGLPNRELMDTVAARKALAAVIRELRPSLLFVPYWEDAHPDHLAAHAICIGARFYSKLTKTDMPHEPFYPRKIFHYLSVHMRVRIRPSFVYDTSEHHSRKMEAIRAYHSQFTAAVANQRIFGLLESEAAYWGHQIGVGFGEPFVCREEIKVSTPAALLEA